MFECSIVSWASCVYYKLTQVCWFTLTHHEYLDSIPLSLCGYVDFEGKPSFPKREILIDCKIHIGCVVFTEAKGELIDIFTKLFERIIRIIINNIRKMDHWSYLPVPVTAHQAVKYGGGKECVFWPGFERMPISSVTPMYSHISSWSTGFHDAYMEYLCVSMRSWISGVDIIMSA